MAAQKLFGDFPNVSGVPGMVTPNITADINSSMSIQDQAAAYALQQRMKADQQRERDMAAAKNSRLGAYNLMFRPSSGRRPGTSWTTGSTVQRANNQFPAYPGFQGPVVRTHSDAQSMQRVNDMMNRRAAQDRRLPLVLIDERD